MIRVSLLLIAILASAPAANRAWCLLPAIASTGDEDRAVPGLESVDLASSPSPFWARSAFPRKSQGGSPWNEGEIVRAFQEEDSAETAEYACRSEPAFVHDRFRLTLQPWPAGGHTDPRACIGSHPVLRC